MNTSILKFFGLLWGMTRPYRKRFLLGVFFSILNGISQPVVIATSLFVFAVMFTSNSPHDLEMLKSRVPSWTPEWLNTLFFHCKDWMSQHTGGSLVWRVGVVSLIPLVMLLRGAIAYLTSYLMSWVAIRAICDLRARLFQHLLNLPLSFFTKTSTGELMSRTGDIGILQNMISISVSTLISAPFTIIFYLSAMITVDWRLTLAAFLLFPVCVIPIVVYSRKGRRASAALQTEQATLAKLMHESFTGNRIIKAYNLEEVMTKQFDRNLGVFIRNYMRMVQATESPGPVIEVLGAIGIAAMFLHLAGSAGVVGFLGFVISLLMLYSPIKALVRLYNQITQAQSSTQRVFELLATTNTLVDPPHPVPVHAAGAEIQFDNVSFGYGHDLILHDITLTVKPGQMFALVGRTGSGKTTLTNLLLRFYDPTAGAIRIGGVDLRHAALRELRSQIAVVTQDILLFNDTLRNNIACGRPGASDAEIEAAARHAHAHEFIMEKPGGYDATIGERGVQLSGGQRQRLSIARAILRNAPILVLDEATSSLDNESERHVQAALDGLMVGRTTIVIAHRLSTVQHADVILVLDHGRIVESGKHAELLAKGGVYQRLHAAQFDKPQGKPQSVG